MKGEGYDLRLMEGYRSESARPRCSLAKGA